MEHPEKQKEDLTKIQDGGSGQLHPPLAGRFAAGPTRKPLAVSLENHFREDGGRRACKHVLSADCCQALHLKVYVVLK